MYIANNLKVLRDRKKLSQQKFAAIYGITRGQYQAYENGRNEPTLELIRKISDDWNIPVNVLMDYEFEEIKIIDENGLKISLTDGVEIILSPEGTIQNELPQDHNSIKLVPYYDLDVTAGNFKIFTGENKEQVSSMVRVPAMMDVDAFVNVSGSSMEEKYCSGDIIGIKKIEHKNFIEWGEAHVVITNDDRRLFKYVRRSNDKEIIILRSENREENDDIDLPVNLVVSMFIVRGLIRRKTM